jgi:predicted CopG family antitoxin
VVKISFADRCHPKGHDRGTVAASVLAGVFFYLTRPDCCGTQYRALHGTRERGGKVTKKVTISVPDELHEKMERWRGDFNFSRIFQQAVEKAIEAKESFRNRLKEGDHSMEEIIARLSKEKAEIEQVDFNLGKKDGLEWAKVGSYADLLMAAEADKVVDLMRSQLSDFGDYFSEQAGSCAEQGIGFEEWSKGWLSGVKEFWAEVRSKL